MGILWAHMGAIGCIVLTLYGSYLHHECVSNRASRDEQLLKNSSTIVQSQYQ